MEMIDGQRAEHAGYPGTIGKDVVVGKQNDRALHCLDSRVPRETLSQPRLEFVPDGQAARLTEAPHRLSIRSDELLSTTMISH